MIDEPVNAIDKQIKVFDEQKQNEKYAELESCYADNIGEYMKLISIEKVLNPKWRNAGEKVETLKSEMKSTITRAINDLKIISAFKAEFELNIKDTYLKNLDMSVALAEKNRLEERKAMLEEIKRKEQQTAQEVQEFKPIQTPVQGDKPVFKLVSDVFDVSVTLRNTTPAFRSEMKMLCDKHNIKREFI